MKTDIEIVLTYNKYMRIHYYKAHTNKLHHTFIRSNRINRTTNSHNILTPLLNTAFGQMS